MSIAYGWFQRVIAVNADGVAELGTSQVDIGRHDFRLITEAEMLQQARLTSPP
jgi:hypothetical protein